jgi:hypothetical protein
VSEAEGSWVEWAPEMVTRNVAPVPEGTPGAHRWWALTAVECGNFVVYMDGFIVTLALPTMARQFAVPLSVLKWKMLEPAIDLARGLGMRPLLTYCHAGLADASDRLGSPERAAEAREAAQQIREEIRMISTDRPL